MKTAKNIVWTIVLLITFTATGLWLWFDIEVNIFLLQDLSTFERLFIILLGGALIGRCMVFAWWLYFKGKAEVLAIIVFMTPLLLSPVLVLILGLFVLTLPLLAYPFLVLILGLMVAPIRSFIVIPTLSFIVARLRSALRWIWTIIRIPPRVK